MYYVIVTWAYPLDLIQQFDAAFVMAAAPLVYGGTVVMPHLYQHHKVSILDSDNNSQKTK